MQTEAKNLAKNTYLFDEWFLSEIEKGNINKSAFSTENKAIQVHGHCHQKAIASVSPTIKILSFPENYAATMINSGCCGMAGSFGYEKEHYEVSMKVGELVLFPTVRTADEKTLIVAAGTSCRHQIKDGTGKKSVHPIEILYDALV